MRRCPTIAALSAPDLGRDATIDRHLERCPPCRAIAELAAARTPVPRSPATLELMDDCAAIEPLLALSPDLATDDVHRIDRHVAVCGACRAVAWALAPEQALARAESALPTVPRANYAFGAELARGGMGRIHVAWDVRIGRPVAIKELLEVAPTRIARFEREARVASLLQHPGIIPVYEIGRWPTGEPFYAMKIVAGRSLDAAIAEARTAADRLGLVRNVIVVAEAMAYAHSKRVIHRDLKPANVLVGAFGETVVIDWGLAKDLAVAEPDDGGGLAAGSGGDLITVDGTIVGTAAYMPPEQASGQPVDERADVYALGAMLYHVLSGRPPYEGPSTEIVEQLRSGSSTPPALNTRRPWRWRRVEARVTEDLRSLVDKAMARAPADRYRDAGELAEDLRRYQHGQMVLAHDYSIPARIRRWAGRHRAVVLMSGLLIVTLGAVGHWSLARILVEREVAQEQRRIAIAERNAARRTAATLLEERGRTALLEGTPLAALAFLEHAYQTGSESPSLRLLLHAAARDAEALRRTLPDHGAPVRALDYDRGGTRLLTVSGRTARVWSVDDGTLLVSLASSTELAGGRFAPDGDHVVLHDGDGRASLWRAADGQRLAELDDHVGAVTAAEFSPDGARLLTVATDARARLRDADGRLVTVLDVTRGGALGLNARGRFSPDGRLVLTWGDDGVAQVWDAGTGALRAVLAGHLGAIASARGSADGRRVVTAGADGTARVWDAATGRPLRVIAGHTAGVVDAAESADGARVVTASKDRTAKLWDAKTGDLVASLAHRSPVVQVALAPGGRVLLTAGADGVVRLWGASDGAVLAALEGHRGPVVAATFRPDGAEVATAGRDGRVLVWRTGAGIRLVEIEGTRSVELDAAGRLLSASAGPDDERVELWDARRGLRLQTNAAWGEHLLGPRPFSPDGRRLVVGSSAGAVVVEADGGAPLHPLEGAPALRHVRVSPAGDRIFGVARSGAAFLWDAATGRLVAAMASLEGTVWSQFSRDGGRLLVAGEVGDAAVWDARTGVAIATMHAAAGPWSHVELSASGTLVVAVHAEYRVAQVWEAGSGALVAVLDGALGASPSADGALVAVARQDGGAVVWHVADRAQVGALQADPMLLWSAALSPGSELLVTSGSDGAARVWDWRTGHLLLAFEGHLAQAAAPLHAPGTARWLATFSPDGERVLTVVPGTRASVWDAALETRPATTLARLVARRVPWRVVEGRLEPRSDEARPRLGEPPAH